MENHPVWNYPFLGGPEIFVEHDWNGVRDFVEAWLETLKPLTNDDAVGFIFFHRVTSGGLEQRHLAEADIVDDTTFGLYGDTHDDCVYDIHRCLGSLYDSPHGTVDLAYGHPTSLRILKVFEWEWHGEQLYFKTLLDTGLRPSNLSLRAMAGGSAWPVGMTPLRIQGVPIGSRG